MKKVADVLLTIFAVGILLTLFAGGLTAVGYVAALIIGGERATALCVFLHKQCFPWIIKITTVSAAFGLVAMYLKKTKALSMNDNQK